MSRYFIRHYEADKRNPEMDCIYIPLADGGWTVFELTDDNPNTAAYLAWVAEGNTAEEWEGM